MHKRLAIAVIGWRGLVGRTLMDRCLDLKDWHYFQFDLFSEGAASLPKTYQEHFILKVFKSIGDITSYPIIINCKGSQFTTQYHAQLRASGWNGFWIDAASALRLVPTSCLMLDPINYESILNHLQQGTKDFIGPNCTTALMLMAIKGLIDMDVISWINTNTYQAVSGGGSQLVHEYLHDVNQIHYDPTADITTQLAASHQQLKSKPQSLSYNLIPWIDVEEMGGSTKEELKCSKESIKLIQKDIPIDSTCVRVGSLSCHSQSVTMELKERLPIEEITSAIHKSHPWVSVIPNNSEDTKTHLNPIAVAHTLNINVGRIRYLSRSTPTINLFTVGDQLLWGATEPLRRMAHHIRRFLSNQEEGASVCHDKCLK